MRHARAIRGGVRKLTERSSRRRSSLADSSAKRLIRGSGGNRGHRNHYHTGPSTKAAGAPVSGGADGAPASSAVEENVNAANPTTPPAKSRQRTPVTITRLNPHLLMQFTPELHPQTTTNQPSPACHRHRIAGSTPRPDGRANFNIREAPTTRFPCVAHAKSVGTVDP